MRDTFSKLKSIITSIEGDVQKAADGNKAAGTRVRTTMQAVKATAQTLRKKALEARK